MTIKQIDPVVLFDSNIYLVTGADKTALIDTGTGFNADPLISSIRSELNGRHLDYIILTHRHYDHVGGLGRMIREFSPEKVFAGAKDAEPLRSGDSESTLGTKFGGKIEPMDVVDLREGEILDLGGHRLVVIETPGHTIGSICLFDETTGSLFSGDTVFVGGVGNTVHPTGSSEMLLRSLERLSNIDCMGLYPGHGPSVDRGGREQIEKGLRMMMGN